MRHFIEAEVLADSLALIEALGRRGSGSDALVDALWDALVLAALVEHLRCRRADSDALVGHCEAGVLADSLALVEALVRRTCLLTHLRLSKRCEADVLADS